MWPLGKMCSIPTVSSLCFIIIVPITWYHPFVLSSLPLFAWWIFKLFLVKIPNKVCVHRPRVDFLRDPGHEAGWSVEVLWWEWNWRLQGRVTGSVISAPSVADPLLSPPHKGCPSSSQLSTQPCWLTPWFLCPSSCSSEMASVGLQRSDLGWPLVVDCQSRGHFHYRRGKPRTHSLSFWFCQYYQQLPTHEAANNIIKCYKNCKKC